MEYGESAGLFVAFYLIIQGVKIPVLRTVPKTGICTNFNIGS